MSLLLMGAALQLAGILSAEPSWAREKPQIRTILLEEANRPEAAPKPGQAAWDLVEQSVYQIRKTRQMLKEAEEWSTGIDRPAEEWSNLDKRISRMESTYRDLIWAGLDALRLSLLRARGVAAKVDVIFQSRELYAKLPRPDGRNNAFDIQPRSDTLKAVQGWREEAEGYAAQAEEMLEKGLNRLQESKPQRSPSVSYMDDIVQDAEQSLEKAVSKALELAKAQIALTGKGGIYSKALAAVEAYGGSDGQGSYNESLRDKAVQLSNEAKRHLVLNEYTLASRIEEMRTMAYLLNRFGKL